MTYRKICPWTIRVVSKPWVQIQIGKNVSKSESRFQKSRVITVCSVISVGSTVKLLNKYDYIIWVWNIKNLWIKIYFIFIQKIGMIFLILSKLNMLNFIWIRNNISHPDFRNAVGNITYEGRVYSIPTWTVQVEQSDVDSPSCIRAWPWKNHVRNA